MHAGRRIKLLTSVFVLTQFGCTSKDKFSTLTQSYIMENHIAHYALVGIDIFLFAFFYLPF